MGDLKNAMELLCNLPEFQPDKDLVSWTVVIDGYQMYGFVVKLSIHSIMDIRCMAL